MRAVILPLAIVILPLVSLSALQLGIPVLAPALIAEVGLAPEAVGLISGCIGLGSVWMFAANRAVTPVLGPLPSLIGACVLSVIGALLVLSGSIAAICAGAVLVGFAYGVTAPAGSQILSAHVPQTMWGTVFSIRQAGVPLGGAIAGLLGAGLAAAYGWRGGLAGLMLLPLLCTGVLALSRKRLHSARTELRFHWVELVRLSIFATPFHTLAAMRQLVPLTFASLGFAAVQGGIFSFFTTFATDGLGLGLALAGSLFATMQVLSFTGRLAIGFVADRVGEIRPVLLGLSLASAGCCVLLSVVRGDWSPELLFLVAAVTGLCGATWNGLFLAEIARQVPAEAVGQATAGVTFFTFIAYMLTPPAFAGIVILAGYPTAFLLTGCAALTAFACLCLKPAREPRTSEDEAVASPESET